MKHLLTILLVHLVLILGVQVFVDWAHAGPRYAVNQFDKAGNFVGGITGTRYARLLSDKSLEYEHGFDGERVVVPHGCWTCIELGNPHEFLSPDDWRYKLHVFMHGDECKADKIWKLSRRD